MDNQCVGQSDYTYDGVDAETSNIKISKDCHSGLEIRYSELVHRASMTMEPIEKVEFDNVYSAYKQLGTGRFGYIILAEHKESNVKIAVKFFPRPKIKQVDFIREYNFSYFLTPHPNIIDTFPGMFQTKNESAFFFVQEFCPCASLREAVEGSNGQGIGETTTKTVLLKVLSALEFMHSENLVHRNLKAENILMFDLKEFNRVKLTDFGLTRKEDTTVKYLEYVNSYHAPELCETVVNEFCKVQRSIDVWAVGVLIFYSIRARFPWQKASIMSKPFWDWQQWLKRKNPQLPKRWLGFNESTLEMFRRVLNPRQKDRWTVVQLRKWTGKGRLAFKQTKVVPGGSGGKHNDDDEDFNFNNMIVTRTDLIERH